MLHGCFLLFNSANIGQPRTGVQETSELVKLLMRTCCVNLHPAVILIAYPAPEADLHCVGLNKPAKSDTLHPTGNEPASPLLAQLSQRGSSGW